MERLPTRWTIDDKEFCTASFIECTKSSKMHWHNYYLITIYTDGKGILNLNGIEKEVTAGDVVVLSKYDFHKYVLNDGEKLYFYSIKFNYDFCLGEIFDYIPIDCFPISSHLNDNLFNLAKDLALYILDKNNGANKSVGGNIACRISVEQLLVMAYENKENINSVNLFSKLSSTINLEKLRGTNLRVYHAICYIQEHFRESSLKVSQVASSVGYTSRYFSEIFKKLLNCSCKLYIQKCRLEFAKRLILSKNLSITEVCFESGFDNLSYFISSFKRMYGVSPSKL